MCAFQHCAGAEWRLVLTHPLLIVLVVPAVRLWQGHIELTATGSFSLLFQWNELPEQSLCLPPIPLEPVSPVSFSFTPEHTRQSCTVLQSLDQPAPLLLDISREAFKTALFSDTRHLNKKIHTILVDV